MLQNTREAITIPIIFRIIFFPFFIKLPFFEIFFLLFFAPTKFKHNYTLYKRAMEPIDNTDNILHSYSPNDEYDFIEIF